MLKSGTLLMGAVPLIPVIFLLSAGPWMDSVSADTSPISLHADSHLGSLCGLEEECGEWEQCLNHSEHRIKLNENADPKYLTHFCMEPVLHSGPSCDPEEEEVTLEMLLEAAPDDILEWVADHPRVRLNQKFRRLETLGCRGTTVQVAASLEALNLTLSDFE